jgi:hypothetical protein
MPSPEEIYQAVMGRPPDQPPSFIVHRQAMLADRQQRAGQVFRQLPPRTFPAAAQAGVPRKPTGLGSCPRCAVPLIEKPGGEITCSVCAIC